MSHIHINYPRLLPPPPATGIITTSLPANILSAIDQTSQYNVSISTAFVALCHYNLLSLIPGNEGLYQMRQLAEMSPTELGRVSMWVTTGIRDFLASSSTSRNFSSNTSNHGSASSHITPRSRTNTHKARERDHHSCVLTNERLAIEVCHIVPYSSGRTPDSFINIFHLLEYFAGPTIANNVKNYLLSPSAQSTTNINRLENLITLDRNSHVYFGRFMFTLTPVGDPLSNPTPLTQYQCIFNWVSRHSPSSATLAGGISVLDCGTQLTEAEDEQLDNFYHRFIHSGDLITLSTDDPVNKPLPHPDLLRLHTALARIVRCAAQSYDGEEVEDGEGSEEGIEKEEGLVMPIFHDWTEDIPIGNAFLAGLAARMQDNEHDEAQRILYSPPPLGLDPELSSKVISWATNITTELDSNMVNKHPRNVQVEASPFLSPPVSPTAALNYPISGSNQH